MSYGAMNSVFLFLTAKQVVFFQQVNKFMYHRGVERIQPAVSLLPSAYFFHYPATEPCSNLIFAFDPARKRAMKPIRVPIDLRKSRIVQVKDTVLVFQWGLSVKVFRLSKLNTSKPMATKISDLNKQESGFAIALWLD